MNDDRLVRDLKALDRPSAVDPAFADRLFTRLLDERRPRSRRLPMILLAATLVIGAFAAALLAGGGSPRPEPVRHVYMLPTDAGKVPIGYSVPSDLDLTATEAGTFLALAPAGQAVYALDGQTEAIPPDARGVKITDVAGATAHYSNGRPLGIDAASFLGGLGTHPVLDVEVDQPTAMMLGTRAALTAEVRTRDLPARLEAGTQPHLDKGEVTIDLWPPSRLIVADAGESIVLIQVWAGSDEELASWLVETERLVQSIRLDDEP